MSKIYFFPDKLSLTNGKRLTNKYWNQMKILVSYIHDLTSFMTKKDITLQQARKYRYQEVQTLIQFFHQQL